MGKKVIIKKVMFDKFLDDGRVIQEENKSIIANLFGIAGAKVTTPEEALTASRLKTKIAALNSENGEAKDLILEESEFTYLNEIIDPKNGNYPNDVNMGVWIAPLIEMFRDATDIKLKEDGESHEDKDK